MKLRFDNPKGLTETQFEHIEKIIGRPLPYSVKNFYKDYAGSRPTLNGNSSCITITLADGWKTANTFEAIDSYETLKNHLSNIGYLCELAKHFNLNSRYVEPEYLFPLGLLPNGAIYIAIDGMHNGKVYTSDNGDFGIVFHSDSLEQFFESVFEYS
jgi:SMI1 / KNR4 family (SUKH-1)